MTEHCVDARMIANEARKAYAILDAAPVEVVDMSGVVCCSC